jgi:hypothetical protein
VAPVDVKPAIVPAATSGPSPVQRNSIMIKGGKAKFDKGSSVIESDNMVYMAKTDTEPQPLFIVNNQLVNKRLHKGQKLNINADKISFYDGYSQKQLSRWGDKARNGVIEISGSNQITID